MPDSNQFTADQQALLKGYIQQLFSSGAAPTDEAFQAFSKLLQGSGIFAGQLGSSGIEDLVQGLKAFRYSTGNGQGGSLWNNFSIPPEIQGYMNQLQGAAGQAQGIMNSGGATQQSTAIRNYLTQLMQGQTGGQQNAQNQINNTFNSGGYNPQMNAAQAQAAELIKNSGMNAQLQFQVDRGQDILKASGMTGQMQGMADIYSQMVANGGRTDQINNMSRQGQNLLNTGGMTPEMSQLMSQIQMKMGDNGMTPEARQLFDKTMGIVNANGEGGALLPMQAMLSMARDEAGTASNNAAEAARRNAFQRLGSSVGSGTVEQSLAENSDMSARAQAEAVRKAATSQQGLQLQQLLGAMGVGGDITKTASGLLGQLSQSGADITRSAAANIGTGASLLGGAEQQAGVNMGIGQQGYANTLQNALGRLGIGNQMITDANSSAATLSNQGLQTMLGLSGQAGTNVNNALLQQLGLIGQQNQAGSGLNQLTGLEFDNQNNAYKNFLASTLGGAGLYGQQQGTYLQGQAMSMDAFLKSMGISSDITNAFTQNYLNAGNGMNSNASIWASILPSLFSGVASTGTAGINNTNTPGFWTNILGGLVGKGAGGLLGGLTGGLSGILGKSMGSLTTGQIGDLYS